MAVCWRKQRFQLTAARRRLGKTCARLSAPKPFQLTAARRRLGMWKSMQTFRGVFQLTAARRRLAGAGALRQEP